MKIKNISNHHLVYPCLKTSHQGKISRILKLPEFILPSDSVSALVDNRSPAQKVTLGAFFKGIWKMIPVGIWVFPKIMVPQNGWFIMENPIKMDDLGVPLFLETPYLSHYFASPTAIF